MSNKQPFYHRVTVLFTSTTGDQGGFEDAMREAVYKKRGVVKGSFVVEEHDAEPGDPADLC